MVQHVEGLWQREGNLVFALNAQGFSRGQQVMVNSFSISIQPNAGLRDKGEALGDLIVTLLNNYVAGLSDEDKETYSYLNPVAANFAEGDYVRCNEVWALGEGYPVVGNVYKVYAPQTIDGQPMIAIDAAVKDTDFPSKFYIPSACFQKSSKESFDAQLVS